MNTFEKYMKTHCRGKENAVKSPELEIIFHMKGTEIRKTVNNSRRRGFPICSGRTGYYYATTAEDLQKTVANLDGRIRKIEAAKEGLLEMLKKVERKEKSHV